MLLTQGNLMKNRTALNGCVCVLFIIIFGTLSFPIAQRRVKGGVWQATRRYQSRG